MEELFARLEKSLSDLAAFGGESDVVEMTQEEFLQWVIGQVELAKSESTEVCRARLAHASLQLGRVRKDFIGPTPTPAGAKVSVMSFRDPSQIAPTAKTVEPTGALPSATSISTNPIPPGVTGGAGKVATAGQLPPVIAGTSGFASPSQATFAKAIDDIGDKLAGVLAAAPVAAAPVAAAPVAAAPVAAAPVAKNQRSIWPLDMSTDFGMGKTDNPGEPEWGFDIDLNVGGDAGAE